MSANAEHGVSPQDAPPIDAQAIAQTFFAFAVIVVASSAIAEGGRRFLKLPLLQQTATTFGSHLYNERFRHLNATM